MDAYLALISLRVVREYADTPIPEEALTRILQAGRATGSSQNRQQWKFYVIRNRERLDALSDLVYAPDNIRRCRLAIAIVSTGKSTFDAARCTQNIALAAWNEGIGSCPNSLREVDAGKTLLGIPEEETVVTILSLGYPLDPHTPREDDVEGILTRINRKPLEELVTWID